MQTQKSPRWRFYDLIDKRMKSSKQRCQIPLKELNIDDNVSFMNYCKHEFYHQTFDDMDLRGVNFRHAQVDHCTFRSAYLKAACLYEARMTNSVFEQTCFNDVDAEFANFDYSDFTYAAIVNGYFQNASFINARFRLAYINLSSFNGADLRGVDFSEAKFKDVSFEDALYSETTKFSEDFPLEEKEKMHFLSDNPLTH